MKTSLRPSILPPASRLVNWLLLMALMRPMQAVQPARDCCSSTSGRLEPKVGWYYQQLPCFFLAVELPPKKITARFIWRSDSDLPVISQKVYTWVDICVNHFSQKRPDTWYISHFWTANHKLRNRKPRSGRWDWESLKRQIVPWFTWHDEKTTEFFRFSPTSSQNHCKDTSFWGGSVLIRFFLAKSIERFCLGSRSTGRCCLFLQWSTFLRPKWTFLIIFVHDKKGWFPPSNGSPPIVDFQCFLPRVEASHGLRNSLLVAPMPTASTAQILGNNESFEPYTQNLYVRRVLSGEFVQARENWKLNLKPGKNQALECRVGWVSPETLVGWVLVEDLQFWGWGGLPWECCNHQAEKNSQRPRSQTVNKKHIWLLNTHAFACWA